MLKNLLWTFYWDYMGTLGQHGYIVVCSEFRCRYCECIYFDKLSTFYSTDTKY